MRQREKYFMAQKNNKKYEMFKTAKRTVKINWGIISKHCIRTDGMMAVIDEDVKIASKLSREAF